MATLIKSKQIQGVVTASVIHGDFSVSGSLVVSGSGIFTNDITASGTVRANQFIGDGSGLTGVIASGTGIAFQSGSTSSTITKLEISGSGAIVSVNSNTASIRIDYTDISSLNSYTSSQNTKNSTLATYTASVDTKFSTIGTQSGSWDNTSLNTFTQSIDGRVDNLEIWSSSLSDTFATDLEVSIVSSSVAATIGIISQNTGLVTTASFNSFSSSVHSEILAATNEQSFNGLISGSSQLTSSYDTRYVISGSITQTTWDNIGSKPTGIVSGSEQVVGILSSLNQYTTSIDSQLSNLNLFTASLDTTFASDIELAAVSASISASQTYISSSIATSLSALSQSSGYINYVTNSVEQLTGIEVADFDSNTAVTFTNGVLKFIFGTPTQPTSVAASTTGFETNRFNNVTDAYSVNGSWNNQGYTLVSASLYEGATLLTQVGSGTSLTYSTTTSGSHTYQLQYTASSPLDGSLYKTSTTTSGTLSKSNPAAPTTERSVVVQLGSTSNQIEQGATGSITFTSSSANPSNSWNLTSVTSNVPSPYYITGSATGSTSISITATANYASPTGENNPDTTTTSTTTATYSKIRSLRYGASAATSFTAGELENLALWDTTLGGTIGTIAKGTTTASGASVTISWTGDKYHYIVFNSSLSNLTNITTGGFGVFGSFAVTTVGQYKVYKIGTLQAGGAGSSITYVLT